MQIHHAFLTRAVLGSLLAAVPAAAQPVDCACAGAYEVGDRVSALVDNPTGASGVFAGAVGTVICGAAPSGLPESVLVRWDDWSRGSSINVNLCDCAAPAGGGTSADWIATCDEIALLPVRNITQDSWHTTIADGIAAANQGDELELGAGVFYERGLILNDMDLTIRGQGPDQTIIDGEFVKERIFLIENGDESTFEGMTIRNGNSTRLSYAGAMLILDPATSITMRDCHFINNGADDIDAGAVAVSGAQLVLDRCVFRGSRARSLSNGASLNVSLAGASLVATQCVFEGGRGGGAEVHFQSSTGRFVNCTFANSASNQEFYVRSVVNAEIDVVGCVFDSNAATFRVVADGTVALSRSVYPNASGDNIDGVPTYVDPIGGDLRLAPGSLGIDAADWDAYVAASGDLHDLGGAPRFQDDPGVFNTGITSSTLLDAGAFEFQGASPVQAVCPGDLDNDGDTDLNDFTILASDFGCVPMP
ncbi:MAG: right-handed parallel beta-helix repeat-containing protein [Planctomycetota bacterium]